MAALLLLAGCNERADEAEIVLRVANWANPASASDFLRRDRQLNAEFEAAHPGVRIQLEQIPGDGQFTPKVLMMHVAGNMPDVMQLDAASGAIFIDNGVLADHAPFIAADPEFDLDLFFENTLELMRRGERIYGIPLDFTPMAVFYNKRLFDAAGVPYPRSGWNWDEFLETARRLTQVPEGAGAPARFGFAFDNVTPFWIMWLWNNGGDILDPSGRRATGFLDGSASIEAVRFLSDLMYRYRVTPTPRERKVMGVDPFRVGLAAMDVKGHWKLLDYRADGLDVGVVGLPTQLERRVTPLYVSGLSVTAQAKHPRIAWEYVKFMTSADVQRRRVASGLAISGNKQAAATFAGNPVEDAFIEEVAYGRPPWGSRVERYPFIEELARQMMEQILNAGPDADIPAIMRGTAHLIDSTNSAVAMQNAKCRMQNAETVTWARNFLHSSFSILHSAPRAIDGAE